MNPFILAALVFGAIGLLQEAMDSSEKAKKSKVVKPEKVAAPVKTGDTIVNIEGTRVQTAAQKATEKAKEKEKEKSKDQKPSDG